MADYTVEVSFNKSVSPPELIFSSGGGDINVTGLGSGSKTIEFQAVGTTSFTFVAIKISGSDSNLVSAPEVSSGNYPNAPFEGITLSPTSAPTSLTLTDVGQQDDLWYYSLGIEHNGTEYWPDPRIYNETSGGPGITVGLVPGSMNGS